MHDTNVRVPGTSYQRLDLAAIFIKSKRQVTRRGLLAEAIEHLISHEGLTDKINRALNHKPGSTHKTTKTQ